MTHQLPQAVDDHPRLGRGSAWNSVPWYGYVNKDLRQLYGGRVRSPYSHSFCGNGSRAACRHGLRASLRAAVTRVVRRQDVSGVDDLTYDKSIDFIRPVTAGTVATQGSTGRNRPTFQQVVAFTRHRPR